MTSDRLDRLGVCSQPGLLQAGSRQAQGSDNGGSWDRDRTFTEPAERTEFAVLGSWDLWQWGAQPPVSNSPLGSRKLLGLPLFRRACGEG